MDAATDMFVENHQAAFHPQRNIIVPV
jgi:hypothetical protein